METNAALEKTWFPNKDMGSMGCDRFDSIATKLAPASTLTAIPLKIHGDRHPNECPSISTAIKVPKARIAVT